MSNGSSDERKFVPAFISPKTEREAPVPCRAGLIGLGECDRHVERGDYITLCPFHMGWVAEKSGYVHSSEVQRRARRMSRRDITSAKWKLQHSEETVAFLRKTLHEERTKGEQPEPKPERKKPPVDGIVYFLRVGGYIKIGWTSNLEKRMRGYQPDTILLAVKPGTRKDERALHRKFSYLKTHGREWFPLAPQIMEEVERTVADHGNPPVVDFSARKAKRIVGPRLTNYIGGDRRPYGHVSGNVVRG